MTRILMTLVLLASSAMAAQAGTNFPTLADYPAANCAKPEKPIDVPEFKIGGDVAVYNKRVKQHNEQITQYNGDLHQYTACVNAYVANAQADIDLIHDKANKAVAAEQTTN
jgi:hypothetical protein